MAQKTIYSWPNQNQHLNVYVAQAVENTSIDVHNVNNELISESNDSNCDMDDMVDDYYDCASPGH